VSLNLEAPVFLFDAKAKNMYILLENRSHSISQSVTMVRHLVATSAWFLSRDLLVYVLGGPGAIPVDTSDPHGSDLLIEGY
jgi:hypothetical protein